MRIRSRASWGALLCLAVASVGGAEQEPAQKFVVRMSTEVTAPMFKMPAISIPGFTMPDLSAPQWVLSGEARYPNQAVEPIWMTVPADLKQPDNRVPLEVPTLESETPDEPDEGGEGTEPQRVQMITRLYWHPTTAEGPVETTVDMTIPALPAGAPGAMAMPIPDTVLAELAKTANGSAEKLPKDPKGAGNYVLNTGGLTATLTGFLPPLKVSQPPNLLDADLTQPITVKWSPVAGARGFILYAMAMKKEGEAHLMVQWVSTLQQPPQRVIGDYEQATTIADDLANGILLPPETTSCIVPGGIFPGDASMFVLTVTAVGNDFYSQENGKVVVGKIRSQWTAMKMAKMAIPARDDGEAMEDE